MYPGLRDSMSDMATLERQMMDAILQHDQLLPVWSITDTRAETGWGSRQVTAKRCKYNECTGEVVLNVETDDGYGGWQSSQPSDVGKIVHAANCPFVYFYRRHRVHKATLSIETITRTLSELDAQIEAACEAGHYESVSTVALFAKRATLRDNLRRAQAELAGAIALIQ